MDYILTIIPALIGYGIATQCRIQSTSGARLKFRPPAATFGIVWPILYAFLGISWLLAYRENKSSNLSHITYGSTSALLGFYIYIYGCRKMKKEAIWTIAASIATTIGSIVLGNTLSRLLLAPLLAWLNFALLLSTSDIQIVS
tara:strand:+ start:2077 stop:2505 length:429 start_codon:yes stop_codon:yes gene_type:complete